MELYFSSSKKQEILGITAEVVRIVKTSGVKDGICHVFTPHATAAVTVNENADPNVCLDIIDALDYTFPAGKWRHDNIDNNAAAHIKASIIGPSESVPIKDGNLQLGPWQDIFLCDFDGPRKRKVIITLINDALYGGKG
jgi:secondary thiamine-phosphate synthase enzyme